MKRTWNYLGAPFSSVLVARRFLDEVYSTGSCPKASFFLYLGLRGVLVSRRPCKVLKGSSILSN